MKKLVKILVFVLALFLMGCGEKKEELEEKIQRQCNIFI